MARDTGSSSRKAAERAAAELLKARATIIGDAAVALDERNHARELYNAANTKYNTAYAAALDAGWEPTELNKLGLDAPDTAAANTGRRRPARTTTVAAAPPIPTEGPAS